MTYMLQAHIEGQTIVLDELLPPNIQQAKISVLIEPLNALPTEEERAQSFSGFARGVLMDPEEDVWEND